VYVQECQAVYLPTSIQNKQSTQLHYFLSYRLHFTKQFGGQTSPKVTNLEGCLTPKPLGEMQPCSMYLTLHTKQKHTVSLLHSGHLIK